MAQITLRGIDPKIEHEIRKIARMSGKSLNRVILEMIYNHTGFTKREIPSRADSLRRLAGGWSDKEASRFFDSIKSSEQIDEGMWE